VDEERPPPLFRDDTDIRAEMDRRIARWLKLSFSERDKRRRRLLDRLRFAWPVSYATPLPKPKTPR
jgi:hypothetical protein